MYKELSLFQLGAAIWLIVTLFGYFIYRLGGSGLYRDGYSLPSMLPMGIDFTAVYSFGTALREGTSGYFQPSNCYPPFFTVALLPLTFFSPHLAYRLYILVLALALFAMIYTCLREGDDLNPSYRMVQALVITALLSFSYPVNFAFERGNSDLVAGAFAVVSLFAMTRGWFFTSIIALTVSTQFKIYPVILLALLFKRFGIRSVIYFSVLNAGAFFILGLPGFQQFTGSLKALSSTPSTWEGNHSIYSYVARLAKKGFIPSAAPGRVRDLFYIVFIGLFCSAWLRSWLPARKQYLAASSGCPRPLSGSEIGLIGMCFCLMSLLPSVSYDYKLAIHIVPFLLLLSRSEHQLFDSRPRARVVAALAAALMALLLIPRNLVALFKTPWLILLFTLYFYLAWTGKTEFLDKAAGENGG